MRIMTEIEHKYFTWLTKWITKLGMKIYNNSFLILGTVSLLFLIWVLFSGCAPAPFKPFKPDPIVFDKTPIYSVQEELDKIPKPDPIVRVYAKKISDTTYEVVENKEEATHIMLAPAEYAKVGALVKLAKTYKELTIDQEKLVNTYIEQINALKELVAMEQRKSEVYRELWISSENAYRHEKWEHDWDNRIHKTGLYGITIGSIVVFLLLM